MTAIDRKPDSRTTLRRSIELKSDRLLDQGNNADAAFDLHQTAERYFVAIILVFTDYKPKTHDIEKLHNQAAMWGPELVRLLPRITAFEERPFKRLKRAYIDARLDKTYTITRQELDWLTGQVAKLKSAVETACRARIAGYRTE